MNHRPVTPPPDRRVWSERLVRISGFRRFLPTQGSQRSFPFVVLFVTLLIVAGLTWTLSRIINEWDDAIFDQAVEQAHREITRRVDAAVGLVRATSALSLAGQALNRETFHAFVDRLGSLDKYPGIQSIGFCRRFTQGPRQEINKRVDTKQEINKKLEDEYGSGVQLKQKHANADEGFAVLYVEPHEANRWILGWDLFDEQAVRRRAIEAARKVDAPRASRRVFLPVDQTLRAKEPGFYVFMPVYEGAAPTETPFERSQALLGFTYCSVVLTHLFEGVFGTDGPSSIVFRVYDSDLVSPDELVYSGYQPEPGYEPRRTKQTSLGVHGVTWKIEYLTQPEFDRTSSRGLIPWIAIGGVICCLLLFLATFALVHARMDSERIEGILREKTMELARSNTDLERFAYVASHDLREPLRMVTSYVQLLEKRYSDKLDSDAREFIGFAVDGATRMNEFLDGLLYLSRVSRDPGVHDPIDSDRALKTTLINLKHTIADASAQVTMEPLPSVRINETHLLQLFQNLIGNAIKFQKNGAPKVHVSGTREGDFVRFSVKDNGIGIDPAFSDQVFEVFRRLHTRDHYPGSGIGLAICKRIVEQRGGKIWFDSKPGEGTTFYFTLPAG
jgi:signal transduction histidine kinase